MARKKAPKLTKRQKRRMRIQQVIAVAIGLIIFAIVGNQGIILSLNITEFEDKFTKPLYYSVLSAIILSSIALIRVNIVKRSVVQLRRILAIWRNLTS